MFDNLNMALIGEGDRKKVKDYVAQVIAKVTDMDKDAMKKVKVALRNSWIMVHDTPNLNIAIIQIRKVKKNITFTL